MGLISPAVRGLVLYGALALTATALIVANARRGRARRLAAIAAAIAAAAALGVYLGTHEVLVVADDGAHPAARHMYELGGGAHGITVINASTRPLRVITVRYRPPLGEGSPEPIAPGARVQLDALDHVGPDDHPPVILVDPPDRLVDRHTWLTWD